MDDVEDADNEVESENFWKQILNEVSNQSSRRICASKTLLILGMFLDFFLEWMNPANPGSLTALTALFSTSVELDQRNVHLSGFFFCNILLTGTFLEHLFYDFTVFWPKIHS